MVIELPPLRERQEDLRELATTVLGHLCRQQGRAPAELSEDALRALQQHSWPGNIRELRNVLERALLFCSERRIEQRFVSLREGAPPATGCRAPDDQLAGPPGHSRGVGRQA